MELGPGEWGEVEGRVSLVGAGAGGVMAVVVAGGGSREVAQVGRRVQVWTHGCGTMTWTTTTCSAGDVGGTRV